MFYHTTHDHLRWNILAIWNRKRTFSPASLIILYPNRKKHALRLHLLLVNDFWQIQTPWFISHYFLGNIAIGNLQQFLPAIVKMVESDSKKRLLALHAAKEVRVGKVDFHISIYSSPGSYTLLPRSTRRRCRFAVGSTVREFAECRGDDKKCCCCMSWKASDYRSIEILARTSCNDLQFASNAYDWFFSLGSHPRPKRRHSGHCRLCYPIYVCWRFAIIRRTSHSSPCWLLIAHGGWKSCRFSSCKLCPLLNFSCQTVRRLALFSFNSAARTKPHLVRDHLVVLLPNLYKETFINPLLIRTVQMGPWTHKVDDGLETRKIAYETMYTLVSLSCIYNSKCVILILYFLAWHVFGKA